ncbi:MAG: hypothetical protein WCS15_01320 [Prevotella sp.]
MYNPRFPYSLKVLRNSIDANGDPILDENGDPSETPVVLTKVLMRDEEPVMDAEGKFITEEVTNISFGYRTASQNTHTSGDVVVSDYKIATPMFLNPLEVGDILELTDYDRTFRGKVVKKQTFNLGSNIWFDDIKN